MTIFAKILENIDDGVYITDGNGITLYLNRAYERLSGAKREQFIGKSMSQVIEEGLVDDSGSLRVINARKEIKMNQTLNNKNRVLLTSIPIFENGEIVLIVTVLRDLTELSNLREEIYAKERDLRSLRYTLNQESDIIYRSNAMKKVLSRAKRVSSYDTTILITGETGVGKDVLVKYIHRI